MPSIFGPMTLGELIDGLQATYRRQLPEYVKSHDERQVRIDWNSLCPSSFHSYRGYYDHLALAYCDHPTVTVKDFLACCEEQLGAQHTGWKGGEYTMDRDTPVWVSDTGVAPGWGLAEVKDEGHTITLVTKKFD